ncbi:hypothetical protein [Salsuginibacillus kocurii]|uniref:hypothetical protein n=1 Tax=Salsuginibacillus kocurii TaxID=427078 RepID=UPI00037DF6A1|nr:hypothetical protein [Salsuginibacillus kocurii]
MPNYMKVDRLVFILLFISLLTLLVINVQGTETYPLMIGSVVFFALSAGSYFLFFSYITMFWFYQIWFLNLGFIIVGLWLEGEDFLFIRLLLLSLLLGFLIVERLIVQRDTTD